MKKLSILFIFMFYFSGCGKGFNTSPLLTALPGTNGTGTPASLADREVKIKLGSTCGYNNEPCVDVTICSAGVCETIPRVLLDTGSYGLRVFKSIMSPRLQTALANTYLKTGSNPNDPGYATCITYADESTQWGPVARAQVKLNGVMTAQPISIHVLDNTFGNIPNTNTTDCNYPTTPDWDPSTPNNICGVGSTANHTCSNPSFDYTKAVNDPSPWDPHFPNNICGNGSPSNHTCSEANFDYRNVVNDPSHSPLDPAPTNANDTNSNPGYNGIIGVGLLVNDCNSCDRNYSSNAADYSLPQYYTCNDSSCSKARMAVNLQISNPIAAMPAGYNNGVIIQLPKIPIAGVSSAEGKMVIGFDNSNIGNTVKLSTTTSGDFTTRYSFTHTYVSSDIGTHTISCANVDITDSYIDSGTNFITMPNTDSMPQCPYDHVNDPDSFYSSLFCPATQQNLTATQIGTDNSVIVPFKADNARTIFTNNPNAYLSPTIHLSDDSSQSVLSCNESDHSFVWGLPFFYGRNVFIGIKTPTAAPYWRFCAPGSANCPDVY